MSEVKFKPLEPLSAWVEYPLITDKLDPPVFRCRLRSVDMFNLMDTVDGSGKFKAGKATLECAVEAVAEWELTRNGEPIPATPENKLAWLRPIIAEQVADKPDGIVLGVAILLDARNRENFLKNS